MSKRSRFTETKEDKPSNLLFTDWIERDAHDQMEEVAIEMGIPPAIVMRAMIEQGSKDEMYENDALWAGMIERRPPATLKGRWTIDTLPRLREEGLHGDVLLPLMRDGERNRHRGEGMKGVFLFQSS
jgi:hypothetical protein